MAKEVSPVQFFDDPARSTHGVRDFSPRPQSGSEKPREKEEPMKMSEFKKLSNRTQEADKPADEPQSPTPDTEVEGQMELPLEGEDSEEGKDDATSQNDDDSSKKSTRKKR